MAKDLPWMHYPAATLNPRAEAIRLPAAIATHRGLGGACRVKLFSP